MTRSYTITAGASNVTPPRVDRLGETLQSLTRTERAVRDMRREQETIDAQMTRQRDWLAANRDDPRWAQRQAIYLTRKEERDDLERRCNRLLDTLQDQIDDLEGQDRDRAIYHLLHWAEPPFLVALCLGLGGLI